MPVTSAGLSARRVHRRPTSKPAPLTTTGLRDWNPARYGTADLTQGGTILNDALSYDVFSQAAQAVKLLDDVAPTIASVQALTTS